MFWLNSITLSLKKKIFAKKNSKLIKLKLVIMINNIIDNFINIAINIVIIKKI